MLIEAYIQTTVFNGNFTMYPNDIRSEILSFYHNPSYFMKAGNLCTINGTQNVLKCKFYQDKLMRRVLCFILDATLQMTLFFITFKVSVLLLFYVASNMTEQQSWMCSSTWMAITEYLPLPIYTPFIVGCIGWLYLTTVVTSRIQLIFREVCKGWCWDSTSNGCYGSVLMPSNTEDSRCVKYEYKVRVTECSEKLLVGIGFVNVDDYVSDNDLNGMTSHNEGSFKNLMGGIILERNIENFTWCVGDILSIVFIPSQRYIEYRTNGVYVVRIRFREGLFTNYRLYIEVVNSDRKDSICGSTRSVTIELLS